MIFGCSKSFVGRFVHLEPINSRQLHTLSYDDAKEERIEDSFGALVALPRIHVMTKATVSAYRRIDQRQWQASRAADQICFIDKSGL